MAKPRRQKAARQLEREQEPQISAQLIDSFLIKKWIGENIVFIAAVALLLIPIWWFPYFPSQDGPDYLQNARIIGSYKVPDFQIVREYYLINKSITPNWSIHLVLAGLMMFVGPLVAEKFLLTGYVILMPLSARYAIGAIAPQSRFLVVLAFPFIHNSLFHLGFYSFSYSLALFFFVVGYWLKHRDSLKPVKVIKLTVMTTLLYFAHPTSFVTAAIGVFSLLAWMVLFKSKGSNPHKRYDLLSGLRAVRVTAVATVCAFIPAFILMIVFLFQQGTQSLPPWPMKMLVTFLPYMSLISFTATEGKLAIALFCLFVAVIVYVLFGRLRQLSLKYSDAALLLAIIYLYLYFNSPRALSGGGLIEQRLVLYPFFALLLWFAGQSFSRTAKLGVQLIAAAITVGLMFSYWTKYSELNDYLKEYLSGMHLIEPNKTLLPLCISHRQLPDGETLSVAVSPFIHAAGYIASQKQIVVLDNHEADTNHFPTLYRPELNPNHHIGRAIDLNTPLYSSTLESQPPEVDLLTYAKRTGGKIDYVLVWAGSKNLARSDSKVAAIYGQLKAGYDLIFESPRWGLMQLYKGRE